MFCLPKTSQISEIIWLLTNWTHLNIIKKDAKGLVSRNRNIAKHNEIKERENVRMYVNGKQIWVYTPINTYKHPSFC